MSKINRRYIDKHWLVFVLRGVLAGLFGLLMLFNCTLNIDTVVVPIGVYLLAMGAIDATNAIYNSGKKRTYWINCILDAIVDITAALTILFVGRDNLVGSLIIISVYTIVSGVIDILHGFLTTVDPTDKFIRLLIGVLGCVSGLAILNAGDFEMMAFFRFFGAYILVVGVTSLIYGVHNHAQKVEDHEARQESAHHAGIESRTIHHTDIKLPEGATRKKSKITHRRLRKSSRHTEKH